MLLHPHLGPARQYCVGAFGFALPCAVHLLSDSVVPEPASLHVYDPVDVYAPDWQDSLHPGGLFLTHLTGQALVLHPLLSLVDEHALPPYIG
jgi:hypothetical protein